MQHEEVRNQFTLFREHPDVVYLDTGASSQKPDVVVDAMADFTKHHYANVHRGIHRLSQESTAAFEGARKTIASFLHANDPDEIVFVRGLTEGMNLLANTFGKATVKKGQTILLSEMEHHSNMIPWMMLAEEVGAKIDTIAVLDSGDIDMHSLIEKLDDNVALLSIVHVSNVLGTVNPMDEIVQLAKQKNVPVIIDGAQAAHHIPVDIQKIGCDFYVITGHKMYGPTGIGAIWGKKEHWAQMPAYHGGGEMVDEVSWSAFTTKDAPAKFEAGTPNIIGAYGLGKAIEFIQSIGWKPIQSFEQDVAIYCASELKQIQGLKMMGSPKEKIGVFAFEIEGFHAGDIATLLDQEGIAVRVGYHCAQTLHKRFDSCGSIRVSLGVYNNKKDIDRLIASLHKAIDLLGGS